MAATECMVVGCESSAYAVHDLYKHKGKEWASLPAEVPVCNLHKDELAKPETEWMLERDERKLYVGSSLRELNEYIVVEAPTQIVGYGTAREFSHQAEDGYHVPMKVRRRGEDAKDITLVVPSLELLEGLHETFGIIPRSLKKNG